MSHNDIAEGLKVRVRGEDTFVQAADHARLSYLVLELEANGVEIVYTENVNDTMKSNLYHLTLLLHSFRVFQEHLISVKV